MTAIRDQERKKYEAAWDLKDYRNIAPGEFFTMAFLLAIKPKKSQTIVDFGTGTGRAALFFHQAGFKVRMLDIAANCLDEDVAKEIASNLTLGCLWDQDIPSGDLGYCTDVMEHIPPEKIDAVVQNILNHCEKCFFNVHVTKDHFGEVLGESLHLTVKPFQWWLAKFQEFGNVTSAKDLMTSCTFIVESTHAH